MLPKGFTLIELIIVVILLGIIAGFSLPIYTKAINKTYQRDASANLSLIYAAQRINHLNTGLFAVGTTAGAHQHAQSCAIGTDSGRET